jgi:hypothetical protein
MRPHRRKCDDRRDIREGILRALRGMALPMCIRHPEARGCSGFVRLAYFLSVLCRGLDVPQQHAELTQQSRHFRQSHRLRSACPRRNRRRRGLGGTLRFHPRRSTRRACGRFGFFSVRRIGIAKLSRRRIRVTQALPLPFSGAADLAPPFFWLGQRLESSRGTEYVVSSRRAGRPAQPATR